MIIPKHIGKFGQSNTGSENLAALPADTPVRINTNYMYGANGTTQNIWQKMVVGVNSSFVGKFGPEAKLMQLLRDHYNTSIYMTMHAVGGVTLAQVASTDWNTASTGELFDGMITKVIESSNLIKIPMTWALWIQGEQDLSNSAYPPLYEENWNQWILQARRRLGLPGLKIISVSLSSNQSGDAGRRATVNAAMEAKAEYIWDLGVVTKQTLSTTLPGVFHIRQNGTTIDTLHYDAASLAFIARAMFDIITHYS